MPKNLLGAFVPLLIILLALFIRTERISFLLNKDNGNVITCYDCFRYALLTEQRVEGYIPPVNHLINVPDYVANSEADRMITYLGSLLTNFGLSLKHVYVVIPPLFATFFVIPLFLWLRNFAGIHSFLGSALLGVFNFMYWIRTSPGRYDTDFLILFFLFLILWFLTEALKEERYERSLIYTFLAGLSLNIFMWWYPKPIFVFLFTVSLLLGCIAFGNTLKMTVVKLTVFVVTGGLINVAYGIKQLWFYIENRVFHEPSTFVPVSISAAVVELQPLSFKELTKFASDNPLFILIGFLGLIALTAKRFKYMTVTLPFIAMGLSAFVAGNRMLIYLAPFLGLGIGFAVEEIQRLMSSRFEKIRTITYIVTLLIVFLMTFPPSALAVKGKLLFSDRFYNELIKIKDKIEPDAFIWTWWDFGNFIQYTMRRGTYIDNGNWNIVKIYAVAHSFISKDEKKARNIIAYVSNNIELKEKFKDKDYKDFLKEAMNYRKPIKNNVYILLSPDLLMKPLIRQVGSYGTDLSPKFEAIGSDIFFCERSSDIVDCGILTYDIRNKKFIDIKADIDIIYFYDRNTKRFTRKYHISSNKNFILFFIKDRKDYYAVVVDADLKNANLVKWFLLKRSSEQFELIYDNFPLVTLYKVK